MIIITMNIIESQRLALKWIYESLKYFSPLDNGAINDPNTNKMFNELHLFLFLAYRNRRHFTIENFEIVELISQFTEPILLNPRYYEQIQIDPHCFRINGSSIIFYLNYKNNRKLESIIKRTYKTARDITPEIIPFRKMDLEYNLYLASSYLNKDGKDYAKMQNISKTSILASKFDLINFSISEEYALTHSLFYLSDFGERPIFTDNNDEIEHSLLTLTLKNILANDMDLLGEYIINLCNLNINNEVCDIASKTLFKSQRKDGSFPAPKRSKRLQHGINHRVNQKDYVNQNYHVTLVALIATVFLIKSKNGDGQNIK
ncbi:hypothetical protein CLV62_13225 [Dysgonomonas alginatilytica]|uniref:DUF6895 domain-containing protein n=2 Tax=Dysgonomonas alginatilytica TaxID=1605892 RepID=A0A2V3PR14_9BACT|nr:hypothetical protein CLV62_13225 [Dysgonomonas alginatilytica]